jgi:hypothetical protein
MHILTPLPAVSALAPPQLAVGILIAQSRWTKPLKKPVVGKNVWFWLHMFLNIAAVALVIAGFAIAARYAARCCQADQ